MNTLERGRGSTPQETERPTGRRIIMITPRELNILTRLAQGDTHKEVANQLSVSETTFSQKYLPPILEQFGTLPKETVKQAVILGVVTDIEPLSEEQLRSLSKRERDILDATYKHPLSNNLTSQLAKILHLSEFTVKKDLPSTYGNLGARNMLHGIAKYARTIEPPAQKPAIVCIQEKEGDVTEQQIRWFEDFAQRDDGREKGRPDHIEQRMQVLRNGGTLDFIKEPLNILEMLREQTQLQVTETGRNPQIVIWPAVSREQRDSVAKLFSPGKPLQDL